MKYDLFIAGDKGNSAAGQSALTLMEKVAYSTRDFLDAESAVVITTPGKEDVYPVVKWACGVCDTTYVNREAAEGCCNE